MNKRERLREIQEIIDAYQEIVDNYENNPNYTDMECDYEEAQIRLEFYISMYESEMNS